MRFHAVFAAAALATAIALPAQAADTAQQTSMKTCAATWKTMSAADKAKTKYTDYMSTCMKGGSASTAMAAKPAMASGSMSSMSSSGSMKMAAPAAGGSAKCKDGTTVTYKKRSGTCSGHGGVASWM
ncbi:MAG TPA: hypothetical protein VEM35_00785 [Rhizomicrobium sp.]|nr:hypothetical protein [Rhizomicrobium sp.]